MIKKIMRTISVIPILSFPYLTMSCNFTDSFVNPQNGDSDYPNSNPSINSFDIDTTPWLDLSFSDFDTKEKVDKAIGVVYSSEETTDVLEYLNELNNSDETGDIKDSTSAYLIVNMSGNTNIKLWLDICSDQLTNSYSFDNFPKSLDENHTKVWFNERNDLIKTFSSCYDGTNSLVKENNNFNIFFGGFKNALNYFNTYWNNNFNDVNFNKNNALNNYNSLCTYWNNFYDKCIAIENNIATIIKNN